MDEQNKSEKINIEEDMKGFGRIKPSFEGMPLMDDSGEKPEINHRDYARCGSCSGKDSSCKDYSALKKDYDICYVKDTLIGIMKKAYEDIKKGAIAQAEGVYDIPEQDFGVYRILKSYFQNQLAKLPKLRQDWDSFVSRLTSDLINTGGLGAPNYLHSLNPKSQTAIFRSKLEAKAKLNGDSKSPTGTISSQLNDIEIEFEKQRQALRDSLEEFLGKNADRYKQVLAGDDSQDIAGYGTEILALFEDILAEERKNDPLRLGNDAVARFFCRILRGN